MALKQLSNLLQNFFDALNDEDMLKQMCPTARKVERTQPKQQNKGVAFNSDTIFFKWLCEEDEEEKSDHN